MNEPRVLISWNVNGLRAAVEKGLVNFVKEQGADAYCFQEVKADQVPLELQSLGYEAYLNASRRPGYSGTLSLLRQKPLFYAQGLGIEEFDLEGRVQTFEYPSFYLVNSYFPNSQHGLPRLPFKLRFNEAMLNHVESLRKRKPVIMCGDFNVAHQETDIARPKENEGNAGFTREERAWMTRLLEAGYVDAFRIFVKEGGHYTWWSYRFKAREKNIGWRIDYFVVSEEIKARVRSAEILEKVRGSDHAPVKLVLA